MFIKKKMLVTITFVTMTIFVSLSACKNHSADTTKQPSQTESKAEVKTDTLLVSVFSCPMHPEVKGKEGDKCPKCGMALTHKD